MLVGYVALIHPMSLVSRDSKTLGVRMPYKAVIFDLDGTLLNTLEDIGDSVNRVLEQRGLPGHELDAYRYFVGDGVGMLITRALPEAMRTEEVIRGCIEAFWAEYDQSWKINTRPYEGVPEMLDAIEARGLKMAILSNKPHEFTTRCVSELLPGRAFDPVLGQREGIPRKPDPAGALEVAGCLDVSPQDFLYLGDTSVDMRTAVAAGMYPVGALWGFRPAAELREGGARALIERPQDILNLLG